MTKDPTSSQTIISVLVPLPSERPYSYALPEGWAVTTGSIVRVPLGPREVSGIVTDGPSDEVSAKKLRPISKVFDCPPLSQELMRFIHFVSEYTLTSPGMVARMVLRAPTAFEPEAEIAGLRYIGGVSERLTPARKRVLELAEDGRVWTRSGLAHAAGTSLSVVDGLYKLGLFEDIALPQPPVVMPPDADYAPALLESSQKTAAESLVEAVDGNDFKVILLDGVTGSGKTEVYFEAIARAIKLGRQILILLPEISLTQQFLDRFERRFGAPPAQWHSDLAPNKREKVWRQVIEGKVQVVAGARSALYLPFRNLGLIIVDEEHDAAFNQEERVFYNARDMAVARASFGQFPVILSSATPSIETRVNALQGRYQRVHLPARYAAAAMPELHAIDMRKFPPPSGHFLSPPLVRAMTETLAAGKQSLLFLNRRGYAPLTLCRVCGFRFQCPNCSSWLVEHRFLKQLMCHHCGFHQSVPEACPECGTLDHLAACGPGVERIAEEAAELLPDARIIVLSTDLVGGVKRLRLELAAIEQGEVDIIIGTQLVAKGHNFPKITLVGVIDADLGMANGDPRAAERTFQLLSQVTGRAGRTGIRSFGLIQTYQPDQPVLQAIISGDSAAFYQREIEERKRNQLPPFGRLAALIVSAEKRADAEQHARELRKHAPRASELAVLGPAEAPLALIRGRYRFRLLVHGSRRCDIQSFIKAMLGAAPKPRGSVRVQINVDPQSFL